MDPSFLVEALTQVSLPGQAVVLALMLGCGVWTALRPGLLPVIGLLACGAVWSRADTHFEGRILISFSTAHGLTLADLLIPALGCIVLLRRQEWARYFSAGCARRGNKVRRCWVQTEQTGQPAHEGGGPGDVDAALRPLSAAPSLGGVPARPDLQVHR